MKTALEIKAEIEGYCEQDEYYIEQMAKRELASAYAFKYGYVTGGLTRELQSQINKNK
jgi:hypothetical protein